MKRIVMFFTIFFLIFFINGKLLAQEQGGRYAECDQCGYCESRPVPQGWVACQKCLYPGISGDATSNESLLIDPVSNAAPTIAPGKQFTYLGCLGNGKSFTDENASGVVVQSILDIIFSVIGGVAFLYLLYGSTIVATSQSQPERLNYGKRIIYAAIVGLLFSLGSVLITKTIFSGILKIPTTSSGSKLQVSTNYGSPQITIAYSDPVFESLTVTPVPPSPTPEEEIIIEDPLPTDEPIPTDIPITAAPTATNVPKATAVPAPTKIPAPPKMTLGNVRPGNSITEIAQIAETYTCTPKALLLAIKEVESGAGGTHVSITTTASVLKYYNTYGWWKSTGIGESWFGLNYNTITGLGPSDSNIAGQKVSSPIGNQSMASAGIMGIMQISQSEQDRQTTKFKSAFDVTTIDRRLPFDAMVIGGFLYKSMSTEPSACNLNWDLKYLAKVGCTFYGVCKDVKLGVDYCQKMCDAYNKYGGTNFNCAGAANTLKAGTCDIK